MKTRRLCQRTLCVYKPGQTLPLVTCSYHWNGAIPCTGRYICQTCGATGDYWAREVTAEDAAASAADLHNDMLKCGQP